MELGQPFFPLVRTRNALMSGLLSGMWQVQRSQAFARASNQVFRSQGTWKDLQHTWRLSEFVSRTSMEPHVSADSALLRARAPGDTQEGL